MKVYIVGLTLLMGLGLQNTSHAQSIGLEGACATPEKENELLKLLQNSFAIDGYELSTAQYTARNVSCSKPIEVISEIRANGIYKISAIRCFQLSVDTSELRRASSHLNQIRNDFLIDTIAEIIADIENAVTYSCKFNLSEKVAVQGFE